MSRPLSKRMYDFKILSHCYLLPILLLCFCTYSQAQKYRQLTGKVNITTYSKNVSELLSLLKQQTTYNLVYNEKELSEYKLPRRNFVNRTMGDVLFFLEKEANVDVAINGNSISFHGNPPSEKKETTGVLTGKVLDDDNATSLAGVKISIGNNTVYSKENGAYTIKLPPGNYNADVTTSGYLSKNITDIEVQKGIVSYLDVSLKKRKGNLEDVVVNTSARREGVVALLVRQKNSPSISDGISAEQIARSPDRDVAQVLRRVTGVSVMDNKFVVVRGLSERYNQSVLNGQIMPSTELNRKSFSFDVIPANIIENITIVKTLTPDRSAEFGGASVDVKTIDIPVHNFFNISFGMNYNSNTTGKDFISLPLEGKEYWGRVSDHRKFLGSLNWKSNQDMKDALLARGGDGIKVNDPALLSNNWGVTTFKAPLSPNFQATFGRLITDKHRNQWGITAGVSYRNLLQNQGDLKYGRYGFYSRVNSTTGKFIGGTGTRSEFLVNMSGMVNIAFRNPHHTIAFRNLYLRNLNQSMTLVEGSGFSGITLGYIDAANQSQVRQHQLSGEHLIGNKGIKVNWVTSYMDVNILRPDNHQLLTGSQGVAYLKTGPGPADYNIDGGTSDLSAGTLRLWSRAHEKNWFWDASVSIPFKFHIGNVPIENIVKTGYSGWYKDRYFYLINIANLITTPKYPQPIAEVFTPENGLRVEASRFGDMFSKPPAKLHADFIMLDNKIGKKWRLVWGVRHEYFDLNKVNEILLKRYKDANGTDFSEIRNREKKNQFFPSANLVYSLTSTMNLRLAYSRSIVRPDLRELSSMNEYDFELGGSYYSGQEIRSTIINNYDFRYEWYPSAGSVFTTTAFYKKLDHPMEIYQMDNRIYILRNSRYAKNKGIETEFRQSLAPITSIPILRNITVAGNFSYLWPKVKLSRDSGYLVGNKVFAVEIPDSVEIRRPQMGASSYLVNAGIYYDSKLLSVSVLYNYFSNRTLLVGHSFPSLMELPINSLDGQIAFHLLKNRRLQATVNFTNLLNKEFLQYLPSPKLKKREDYKPSDFFYKKGDDIRYGANPGRTYGLTVSYNF